MSESIDDLFARYGSSYRALLTIAAISASFTMVMSGTIVNVATPDVMGAFGIGLDRAQPVEQHRVVDAQPGGERRAARRRGRGGVAPGR